MPFKKPVSAKAKDLLRQLLVINPEERITWKGFFNHSIFNEKNPPTDSNAPLSSIMRNALKSYIKANKMFNQNKNQTDNYGPGGGDGYGGGTNQRMDHVKVNEQDIDAGHLEEINKKEIADEIEMRYQLFLFSTHFSIFYQDSERIIYLIFGPLHGTTIFSH